MKLIGAELTPYPHALKYVLDGPVIASGTLHHASAPDPASDPLAAALFALSGVKSVYYQDNFITVEKGAEGTWEEIEAAVARSVTSLTAPLAAASASSVAAGDEELLLQVNAIIDEMVRPALARDGGGLQVVAINGNDVVIRYEGACGGCPHAAMGTLFAIQNLLRHRISDDLNVVPA